jgi:hypothetical protein
LFFDRVRLPAASTACLLLCLSTLCVAQETQPNAPAAPAQAAEPLPPIPGQTVSDAAKRAKAEQQLKQQEKQRILGIIPNFTTSNIPDAVALSPKQKFHLAMKQATDPFQFLVAGLDAGISQWNNDYKGYGQGAQGYAKRFGASYADSFDGALFGGAVFPILLHQDPRYFRKGTGSFKSRLFYSLATTIRAKNDDGKWVPNYSNILGNIVAGGISNAYYPSTDRGAGLLFERAFTVTAEGAAGGFLLEFWPDISRKVFHKH